MTKPKQAATQPRQPRFADPFLENANVDLRGFPQFSESLATDTSDPFLQGDDVHLVEENRHSLKAGILALANYSDAEVAQHLKAANITDPTSPKTFYLANGDKATVYLGNDSVFRVTHFRENGTQQTVQFPDSKTQESAMFQAAKYFARDTVSIRALSKEEELYVIRLCHLRKIQDAISNYLFFRCGALDFDPVDDPRYTPVSNDCVWFVFEHLTPQFNEDTRVFMENFLANRKILNLDLLKAAFDAWETEHARAGLSLLPRSNPTETQGPEQIDLDSLSDEEISNLRESALREYARQSRR
jgi:hypothetical protein